MVSRLAALRKKHGLSQAAVAMGLGLSQSDVSKIEKFERRLDVIEFIDFVRAINPASLRVAVLAILREAF